MAFLNLFKSSARELKSVYCLAVTGIFIAFYLVMEIFLSVDIGFMKVNFAFLGLAAIGMLYGPVVAMLAAIPCDILGAALRGEGMLFVFTFIAIFEGLVYGIFLYRYEIKKSIMQNLRIIAAQTVVVIVSHLIFNTVALYYLGFISRSAGPLMMQIAARFIKNIVELPIDVILMFMILVPVKAAHTRIFRKKAG